MSRNHDSSVYPWSKYTCRKLYRGIIRHEQKLNGNKRQSHYFKMIQAYLYRFVCDKHLMKHWRVIAIRTKWNICNNKRHIRTTHIRATVECLSTKLSECQNHKYTVAFYCINKTRYIRYANTLINKGGLMSKSMSKCLELKNAFYDFIWKSRCRIRSNIFL